MAVVGWGSSTDGRAASTPAFRREGCPLWDCDGVVANLYEYLWAKNSQGGACPGVRLPQTVVYRERAPDSWYFFSKKEGTIMRKRSGKVVGNAIAEALGKAATGEGCGAAATLMFPVDPEVGLGGAGGLPVETGGSTVVWHMNAATLRQWVLQAEKPRVGVLQAFVEPRELSNTVIRAVWSPQLCLLERRTNRHPLSAVKVDLAQRLLTFEGAAQCSHSSQIAGAALPAAVREVCNNIVEHVEDVSDGEYRIARMVLNFKVDRHQQLQLLYCSSLRLEGGSMRGCPPQAQPRPQASANMSPHMLPVSMGATTAEEAARGRAVSPPRATRTPASSSPSSRPTSGTVRASPHTASRSAREGFVCVVDGLAHEAQERSEATFKTLLQLAGEEVAEGALRGHSTKAVPTYIQRADPIISPEKFRRVCHTHDFLYRKAAVCRACSRRLVEVARDAIAAEEAAEARAAETRTRDADEAYSAAWARHLATSATPSSCPPPLLVTHDRQSTVPSSGAPMRSFSARARDTSKPGSGAAEDEACRHPRPHSAAPTAPPYWRGGAELPWRRRGSSKAGDDAAAVPVPTPPMDTKRRCGDANAFDGGGDEDGHVIGPTAVVAIEKQQRMMAAEATPVVPTAFLPKKGYHAAPPPAPSAAQHSALEVSEEPSWAGKRSAISALGEEGRPASVCHDIPEGDENVGTSRPASPLSSTAHDGGAKDDEALPSTSRDENEPASSSLGSEDEESYDSEVEWVEPDDDPVVRAIRQRFPGSTTETALREWIVSGGPSSIEEVMATSGVEGCDGSDEGFRDLLERAAQLLGFASDGTAVVAPSSSSSRHPRPSSAVASGGALRSGRRRVVSAVAPPRGQLEGGMEWRQRNALSEDGSTDAYDALGIRNDDSGDAEFLAGLEDEWEAVGVWTDSSTAQRGNKSRGAVECGKPEPREILTTKTAKRRERAVVKAHGATRRVPLAARPTAASMAQARPIKTEDDRPAEPPRPEPPSHPKRQEQLRSLYAPKVSIKPRYFQTNRRSSAGGSSNTVAADAVAQMMPPDLYHPATVPHSRTEGASLQQQMHVMRVSRENGTATVNEGVPHGSEVKLEHHNRSVPYFAGPAARLTTDEHALLQEMLV